MKESQSGNALPTATYTWPIANQAIAAGAAFSPAAVVVAGARIGNGIPLVAARIALPATAAGSAPHVDAFINANDAVTLRISNQSAAALVALGVDVVFDIMVLPLRP
jgi:hypothetical protein